MESPWKVIAAFLGVFVAGAVFGGFFTVGVGARWLRQQPAPAVALPVAVAPAASEAAAPKAAPAQPAKTAARPPSATLLQVPQSWQAPMLMRRYAAALDLTPEQKERINPLLQRATEDYNRLRQNTYRETAIILQRLQQDLSRELTPEQVEKLHKIEQRERERLQKIEQKAREQKKSAHPGAGKNAPKSPANSGGSALPSGTTSPAASSGASASETASGTTSASGTAAETSSAAPQK